MTVVFADDTAIMRERLTELLSEIEGIEVVGKAGDAMEAERLIRSLSPDIAIIDLRMPGGGLNLLKRIQEVEGRKPLVIVLTAYPFPQYRTRSLELGASYFFDKSHDMERLVTTLRGLVAAQGGG